MAPHASTMGPKEHAIWNWIQKAPMGHRASGSGQESSLKGPQATPGGMGHPWGLVSWLHIIEFLLDGLSLKVLALDDAEETICMGLMDEVCEVCTILRRCGMFSEHPLA